MTTDNRFYQFFLQFPEASFQLLGLENLPCREYRFDAITLKQMEAEIDGFFRPPNLDYPFIFIEVYGYPYKFAYKKMVGETCLYLKQNEYDSVNYLMFLIFIHKNQDLGDPVLETLKQTGKLRVIYLEEIVDLLPDSPFFTLIRIIVDEENVDRDLERVENSYRQIDNREIQINFLEQCLSALLNKYKFLDRQLLKAMWDPTKPFHVSESLAIRQYAQEYAREHVAEYAQEYAKEYAKEYALKEKQKSARVLYYEKNMTKEEIASILSLSIDEVNMALIN